MPKSKTALARATPDLLEVLGRINQENPTRADLAALREAMRKYPRLWSALGDMTDHAASAMIGSINAKPLAKEIMKGDYEGLKRDLGHETASPLERILIGQVALTWLRLGILEQRYTHVTMTAGGTLTTEAGDFWDRRLSAAQRRYLRACETLARIRKMSIETLQINIAERQVNIAGRS